MLEIVLMVNAPSNQAIGIKEAAAMYFERFGDGERRRNWNSVRTVC